MRNKKRLLLLVAGGGGALCLTVSIWILLPGATTAGDGKTDPVSADVPPSATRSPVFVEPSLAESAAVPVVSSPGDSPIEAKREQDAGEPLRLPRSLSEYYSLPPTDQIVASTLFNPAGVELGETELAELDRQLKGIRKESIRLASARVELVDRYVQMEFENGAYEELTPVNGSVSSRGAPAGSTVNIRNRTGLPPVQITLAPGEYPDLDAVKSARLELARSAKEVLEKYFLKQDSSR